MPTITATRYSHFVAIVSVEIDGRTVSGYVYPTTWDMDDALLGIDDESIIRAARAVLVD